MVVYGCFQVGLCFGGGLGSNCSKGPVEISKYFWDCTFLDEAGVFVDEVGQAIVVKGGINFLDYGSLGLVTNVEGIGLFGEAVMGLGDLGCRRLAEIWEDWDDRTNKWDSLGASFECK